MRGDNSFSCALEAFDDIWLLEDAYIENIDHQINTCRDDQLDFSPNHYFEQGISAVAETLSIDISNGILQENVSINNKKDSGFSSNTTLLEASKNADMFVEQESNNACHDTGPTSGMDTNVFGKQENSIVLANSSSRKSSIGKRLISSKTKVGKSKTKHLTKKGALVQTEHQVEEKTLAKKQDHNAKERIRRMKLHASYLSLGSLLPNSLTSKVKKRWTAPVIIDKVLEYIPELENEIEQLRLKKNNMVIAVGNRPSFDANKTTNKDNSELVKAHTISVNEVKKGELILQICMSRNAENVFSSLLQNIEDEGMYVVSASTLHVCDERECYHIHVKSSSSTNGDGGDYIWTLKEKVHQLIRNTRSNKRPY